MPLASALAVRALPPGEDHALASVATLKEASAEGAACSAKVRALWRERALLVGARRRAVAAAAVAR